MTPLKIFDQVVICLGKKPFEFWPDLGKANFVKGLKSAIYKLKTSLESKNLKDTHAYKVILSLEKDVLEKMVDEVPFIQHLSNLVEVYGLAPLGEALQEFIGKLESSINVAKTKLLEHHLSIENLEKKKKKLNEDQQHKSDLDTIQKVGIFYVLEYTLQVLWEFQALSDEDKMKLLKDGLKTKAGNLPAYLPLEDTFRKELCYKIFDDKTRSALLWAFYDLEKEVDQNPINLLKFVATLKKFNLDILNAFKNSGYEKFAASIYTSFGTNLPIDEIIAAVTRF
ncbi:MAG: hypothetical protein HZC26_00250 [Candidatus Magasanikbacteria bacterium]|nr:hypothetical protein [Candidatus Magasanikbacteria bacterium]MBI5413651.1 hypothetical protein [Candidatus Peregrinibacteria bacterium]